MGFLKNKGYKIDVVFVIDATENMTPIMSRIKATILSFGDKVVRNCDDFNKPVDQLRLRVIDFADFASKGKDAIRLSDFYTMPEQRAEFRERVNNIDIDMNGSDHPGNALEALYHAINSDWVKIETGERGRHVIVLATNSVPLFLQERAGCIGYDASNYPANIEELAEIWEESTQSNITNLSPHCKRLFLYAPTGSDKEGHTWGDVPYWSYSLPCTSFDYFTEEDLIVEMIHGY